MVNMSYYKISGITCVIWDNTVTNTAVMGAWTQELPSNSLSITNHITEHEHHATTVTYDMGDFKVCLKTTVYCSHLSLSHRTKHTVDAK